MTSDSLFQELLKEHSPDYIPYEALYRQFHANAELAWMEHETASAIAQKLSDISPDLQIIEGIAGTGLIAILRNGTGRTVMLRADMDALPLAELSGLEYACKKQTKDADGEIHPVMHACGHDMHVTALLAAAHVLVLSRAKWCGTLVFLFQPAEEKLCGARSMVKGGLFEKHGCPIPDVLLAWHVSPHKAGSIVAKPGLTMAAADSMVVTVFGRGGHGSMPHTTVDPIVLASHIVLRLQTIVSREVPPGELAVVTVGALQAGTAANIIADRAVLRLSIRSAKSEWRTAILDAVRRIVRAECDAACSPRAPEFELVNSAPALVNNAALTQRLSEAFRGHFGQAGFSTSSEVAPASEDFGELAAAVSKPCAFWFVGGHDPVDFETRREEDRLASIPSNHSPFFAPVIQPTLKTATEALVVGALTELSGDSK